MRDTAVDIVPAVPEWRGRSVVVTGAGGFIGSHLAETLARDGARVRAFVRYGSHGRHGLLEELSPELADEIDVVAGDLKDPHAVRRLVEGAEVVFHLGALIAIPYSYVHPTDFVQTNVVGTTHLLNACHDEGVQRLVATSTSEVYGTARYAPIDTEHPLTPQSPYSASKIASDMVALSYHYAFGMPVAVLRPFNTYGPRQSLRAVIPTIISQALTRDRVELGSLTPTRDLTFVSDTVDAFLRIAAADEAIGKVVAIGQGEEISIGDLARLVLEVLGKDELPIVEDQRRIRPETSEVYRLIADNGPARELLGWEPRVGLAEGIRRTADWLIANVDSRRAGRHHI
jgi:NAD dependent epimerase/dehydratase